VDQVAIKEKTHLTRQDLVALVRKWGDVNTDGLLEVGCKLFTTPAIDGVIGYKVEASNAVVCGEPVCAKEDKPALAKAFDTYCKENKLKTVYTIVTEDFARWAADNLSAIAIEFGKKFTLDPFSNPTKNKGSKAVLIRKKVKHALKAGVVIKEYLGDSKDTEQQIESILNQWLKKREGPQIYLCGVSIFNDRYGKRWFYAEKDGKILGFLILSRLEEQEGWLLNSVMTASDGINGLSELLVISILEALEKENCHRVVIGPIPSRDLGDIMGIGSLGSRLVRFMFKGARLLFDLDGHVNYWSKFQPEYQRSYLLFPGKNLSFSSIKALMQALNVRKGVS